MTQVSDTPSFIVWDDQDKRVVWSPRPSQGYDRLAAAEHMATLAVDAPERRFVLIPCGLPIAQAVLVVPAPEVQWLE